jgi:hypothetical protein
VRRAGRDLRVDPGILASEVGDDDGAIRVRDARQAETAVAIRRRLAGAAGDHHLGARQRVAARPVEDAAFDDARALRRAGLRAQIDASDYQKEERREADDRRSQCRLLDASGRDFSEALRLSRIGVSLAVLWYLEDRSQAGSEALRSQTSCRCHNAVTMRP